MVTGCSTLVKILTEIRNPTRAFSLSAWRTGEIELWGKTQDDVGMLTEFLSLHPVAIIAISVLVPMLITVPFVVLVLTKKIKSQDGDEGVLGPFVAFTGTAFTLLLAFVIVNVWTDQIAKQDVLFAEMTTIENTLIEVEIIAPEYSPELREKVLEYMDDVVTYEIDEAPPIGGDPQTEATFEEILLIIDRLDRELAASPETAAEAASLFEQTREWIADREMRVNKTGAELDDTFTTLLLLLALLTILSVSLLPSTTRAWAKWVQTLGTAATVGLVMGLVFYIASDSFTREAEEEQVLRIEEATFKQGVEVLP